MATKYLTREEALAGRKWLIVDAADLPLGRVASQVAHLIRGKHKPSFTPNVDAGDFVIVLNAEKVKLTGNKESDKVYYKHTGYPGGLKTISAGDLLRKRPERLIEFAVKGMLPKSALGKKLIKKLKVYRGAEHEHSSQTPETVTVRT